MEAIVLAGGLGTRLRAVAPDLPKPMAPIHGRPFLEFLLDYWGAQGISRAILSVGYKADRIMSHFGKAYHGMTIDYAVETTPCGTGGGLVLAATQLTSRNTFLVVNGDTFFEVPLADMLRTHRGRNADLTMALVERHEPDRYQPVGLNDNGRITSLQIQRHEAKGCFVNGGVYLFEPYLLDGSQWPKGVSLSLERDMFPRWLETNTSIVGYVGRGRFIDIGIPNDYAAAGALISGTGQ